MHWNHSIQEGCKAGWICIEMCLCRTRKIISTESIIHLLSGVRLSVTNKVHVFMTQMLHDTDADPSLSLLSLWRMLLTCHAHECYNSRNDLECLKYVSVSDSQWNCNDPDKINLLCSLSRDPLMSWVQSRIQNNERWQTYRAEGPRALI